MTALSLVEPSATALSSLVWYFWLESVPITRAVIEGRTSLGGSESAMVGLCKALAARGHDVHIFAAKMTLADADPTEYDGVQWHGADELLDVNRFSPADVFVSLRMSTPFARKIDAGLRILWNQDMLGHVNQVASAVPQLDAFAFVSEYHRQQWVSVSPEIIGGVPAFIACNAVDLDTVEASIRGVEKVDHQFCFISRPERGLGVLLGLWPKIRERQPLATLKVCRYDSMYDAAGWGQVCANYDAELAKVNAAVGGIEMVGNLTKPDLYRLIASSIGMLYPGVDDFAETSCIAALEAQACGTPIVASYKGALPETVAKGAGVLIKGEAKSEDYLSTFVDEALWLDEHLTTDAYFHMQEVGRAHIDTGRYTFDALADDWEEYVRDRFVARYSEHKLGVMRQLLHWDHHVAARIVANEIISNHPSYPPNGGDGSAPDLVEALAAEAFCDKVIEQRDLDANQYGEYSMPTETEMELSGRFQQVLAAIRDRFGDTPPATFLDVACGNGSFSLLLAKTYPDVVVHAWDFSDIAVKKGHEAALKLGLASRVHFHVGPYTEVHGSYDGVFCGEFLEHLERPWELIDRLEQHCKPGGHLFLTTPCGPFTELLDYTIPCHRGHTHAFLFRDMHTMWAHKGATTEYLPAGMTPRGNAIGFFIVTWQPGGGAAVPLDYLHTILTTRPYRRVVAGLIVRNEEAWIHKCLLSVWALVDDVVILDTGSTDATVQFAKRFPNVHVYQAQWPHDFSAARNLCLDVAIRDHQAEWFLWIDADEHLIGGDNLHKYLDTDGPFHAFVIRQHHVMVDSDRFFDVPCRIFRTDREIKFYGVVHEQPETGIDEGISPSLDCPDVNIVHYGYEDQGTRSIKLLNRNIDLLRLELMGKGQHPPRELAALIYIRDLVNIAQHIVGLGRTVDPAQLPMEARRKLAGALALVKKKGFDKPDHKLHNLCWPSYQQALRMLGMGFEIEWAFKADVPRLGPGRVVTERFVATSLEEAQALLDFKTRHWLAQLKGVSYSVEPWAQARPADVVAGFALTPPPVADPVVDPVATTE